MSEKPSNAMSGAMIMISDVVESCEVVWLVIGSSRPGVDWRGAKSYSGAIKQHAPMTHSEWNYSAARGRCGSAAACM